MLYTEYMYKAKDLVVLEDEDTGLFFLNPEWKATLYANELGNLETVQCAYPLTWHDVEDVLRLEANRLNLINSKKKFVIDWLYDLITTQVDPTVMQEESEYISNVMDWMKFRAEHPELTKAESDAENVSDDKIKQLLRSGMSFSKK